MSFGAFDSEKLGDMSPEDAVKLFRALLWCSARRAGIPITSITITTKTDVADGGIDAEILPNALTPKECPLSAGNSFYQLKAGASATPWRKAWLRKQLFGEAKKASKATLGEAVVHCLTQKGLYVIVCFGCDPTGTQRRQAVRYLRDLLASAGFKKARVDVWGQSTLAGLMQPFPSLALRLTDRHHLPFLLYDDWRLDGQMTPELHLGDQQLQLIERIRSQLRGAEGNHVRIIGEPGLGKTRLVLAALEPDDLSATVVYFRDPEDFQGGPFFNSMLRSDDDSLVTIVVDDCPPKERASIWNALKRRRDRLRLISLDQGPETSTDEWMKVLECPVLGPEQVKAILADYVGNDHDLDRWAAFCSGSPRVAHAVGDNLRRNPNDILKSPATVPIWDRYVHGNSPTGSQEALQRETVLRHVALFHKFGFEDPVTDEAKFIAGLVERADPAVTWARFQSIIKHFRDRRVLQGKTTLFLVPKALHVYLWLQFWEHYGAGTRIADLLSQLPPSLFRWFIEMFKYGHESPACINRIEQLTSRGGPFDERTFITSGPGAAFLDELAEAHPEATLACMERTIGTWPHSQLLELEGNRQHIVWALEKIAIWKALFQRAAAMLLKLALAENANNSNNATGTFCGLFALGRDHFASSEAPPEQRLPVLRTALETGDLPTKAMALKASSAALNVHVGMHVIGPEHQGMRPLPALWSPQKWVEVFDAYRAMWRLVAEFWRSATGAEKQDAAKVLVDAAFGLIQARWFEVEIIETLNELRNQADTDLAPIVQLIARFRSIKWSGLSRRAAAALRAMDKAIYGESLESHVTRIVLLGMSDEVDHLPGRPYGQKHSRAVRRLAKSTYEDANALVALLPKLVSSDCFAVSNFGRVIGEQDQEHWWWSEILAAFINAGDKRKPDFTAGYLSSIFACDRPEWERTALGLLTDETTRPFAKPLIRGSGLTETILDALCASVKSGNVPENTVAGIVYVGRHWGLSIERCIEFIAWCVEMATPSLIQIGLEGAYELFCFDKNAPAVPEHPLIDLLVSANVLDSEERRRSYYRWAELTKKFVASYPQHAMCIFEGVLNCFDDFRLVLSLPDSMAYGVLLDLIRLDPKASWEIVARHLLPLRSSRARNVLHWLGPPDAIGDRPVAGPLALFDTRDVLEWIDIEPDKRAAVIAGECPRTFSIAEGGLLTREVLIRYSRRDGVQGAFWANFAGGGGWGNASEYHRKRRDEMRAWLADEKSQPIIEWLVHHIEYLSRCIKEEEIQEEREM